MKWRFLVFAITIVGAYQFWSEHEVKQPDGVLAADEPRQVNVSNEKGFLRDGYNIKPQAYFEITARVLSRENYRLGREADLSPVDFALGWGKMSDQRVLEKMKISQGNRFYYWRVKEYPIPHQEIVSSSANMHMIPADSSINDLLSDVHQGHVIRLKGFLVNIDASDGWRWRTSMKRTDSGKGACELIWVEEIEIIG